MRNYDDPVYKEVRIRVLKRDKFKCQMPGCKKKKRLNVHHIEKWANAAHLRYDEHNCITLCKEHHDEVTGQEHLYVPLFQDIIKRK